MFFILPCYILLVLQTSQSDFQPSLDALRDINTDDDNEDIFTHTFDIDYDKLADHISSFPIHKRLDLNPLYCQVSRHLFSETYWYVVTSL